MFRQTNPSSLWGVSISRQNREDGMELGSDLLKESKVSSCFGGVLVCRARSDFWFTKADGGDLPTKSSNVCNLPRMSTSGCNANMQNGSGRAGERSRRSR